METCNQQQPLSIESFSYSWLANLKPSLQTLLNDVAYDESTASSYIEMDPRMPPSKRFNFRNYSSSSHDFNFDFPADTHSPPIVHADELFADGYVVPFFLRKSNSATASPDSTVGSTVESEEDSPEPAVRGAKTRRCSSLRRCGKLISRRVLEKYLELIGPLLDKLSGRLTGSGPRNQRSLSSRSEGRVIMDSNKKKRVNTKLAMKRWLSTGGEAAAPPRVSTAWSEDGWRRSASSSCDSESSILEAVLHCKKSFGK